MTAITFQSPHELLAIVPFVLGFRPRNSIVVLCLRHRRLGVTQRLDLPRPEHAQLAVSALLPSLLVENPDSVVLIGYENHEGDSLPALEALTVALQSRQIEIRDRIAIRGARWRSLDCHNPHCCPPDGSRVPEPADVPGIVAEFIGLGVCPHPDRQALARQIEAGPKAEAVAQALRARQKAKAVDCEGVPRAELFAAWPRILDPARQAFLPKTLPRPRCRCWTSESATAWWPGCPQAPSNMNELSDEVQELFCGLERAWGEDDCDSASIVVQNGVQDRLVTLCAMLPDHVAAPALTVLATFVWWRGDGALARVALDRALRCDPDYRLAQLLQHMVDLAIRPVIN